MAVSPDPVALWQSQQAPAFRLSPAALAAAAEREHARLRRSVAAKSATMALALVVALWFAATVDVLPIRLGCLAAAAGYAQVLYALQRTRRGDAALAATDRAGLAAPSLLHYRAALVRERDRFTGRRLWLPFAVGVPGGLLLLLSVARQAPALRPYVPAGVPRAGRRAAPGRPHPRGAREGVRALRGHRPYLDRAGRRRRRGRAR